MLLLWLPITLCASIISALVMTFVTLAVPIGPWMHVTILLLLMSIAHVLGKQYPYALYATSAISVSASVATAMGFCFPTWYFLAPEQFAHLMTSPWFFVGGAGSGIGLTIGWAYVLAQLKSITITADDHRSYPVGQLMYTVYQAAGDRLQAAQVALGVGVSVIYSSVLRVLQVPDVYKLMVPGLPTIGLRGSTGAMFIALGYVAGHVMGVPLLVGAGLKYGVLDRLQAWWWSSSKPEEFTFALCSGIVAWGALLAMIQLARVSYAAVKRLGEYPSIHLAYGSALGMIVRGIARHTVFMAICALALTIISTWYLQLPASLVLYMVIASGVSAWQIAGIARKTGLALVGRFATWVMVPGLFMWGFDPLYTTLFALGVEVCGMVMVDLLYNHMAAARAGIDRARMWHWQLGGIAIAIVTCAGAFWWLVSTYGLGATSPLVAQRAYSRALLVQVTGFDWTVVVLGCAVSILLGYGGINSTMALAGILLPLDVTLILALGAGIRAIVSDPERLTPFWSGLFAASALGLGLKALFI